MLGNSTSTTPTTSSSTTPSTSSSMSSQSSSSTSCAATTSKDTAIGVGVGVPLAVFALCFGILWGRERRLRLKERGKVESSNGGYVLAEGDSGVKKSVPFVGGGGAHLDSRPFELGVAQRVGELP